MSLGEDYLADYAYEMYNAPRQQKKQTNADRIRSMNNKELARVLEGTSYPWCNTPINCHHNNCYDCCEEWLKKEVEE